MAQLHWKRVLQVEMFLSFIGISQQMKVARNLLIQPQRVLIPFLQRMKMVVFLQVKILWSLFLIQLVEFSRNQVQSALVIPLI